MSRKNWSPILFVLFFISALSLYKFSHNVRSVDVLGLFAGGFSCGVAFAWLVGVLRGNKKD